MSQKTPLTVETYNFLLLHAIFYHLVRVRSFECVVWKKLANCFVVWKLKYVSNFFIGRFFFIWQCVYTHLIPWRTERLNSCTTKIIQCAPWLIHVKSYNLIMIMMWGTAAENIQCERKVRICADFLVSWYLMIFLSSVLIFYTFYLGALTHHSLLYKFFVPHFSPQIHCFWCESRNI